jgi:hypothetical protein
MVTQRQHGRARSRNGKRYGGSCSLLISGLCCSCSLWVGIRLVILAAVMTMEHLDYACHPYQIFTKFVCFARVFAVARRHRSGCGVLTTVLTVDAGSGLQHDTVSTVAVVLRCFAPPIPRGGAVDWPACCTVWDQVVRICTRGICIS